MDERSLTMIQLDYSLVIEATQEPDYFGFFSPDLEGFTGIGNSVEDCLYKARWGMIEHVKVLRKQGLSIPPKNLHPKIIIQNEEKTVGKTRPAHLRSSPPKSLALKEPKTSYRIHKRKSR